jgi:ADP-ribose pyrophosphatase YjhB (NUDIX family)
MSHGVSVASTSAAVILRRGGHVLLIHENYGRRRWSLPGGAVEPGEAPWEAAVREAREEVGVDVQIAHMVAVCFIRRQPQQEDHLAFGFTGEVVGGQIRVADPTEIAEIAWMRPEEWPEPRTLSGPILVAEAVAGSLGAFREADGRHPPR